MKRKPYNLQWAKDTIEVCEADHVDCFVKQLGSFAVCDNANLFDFPDDAQLIAHGKGFAQCRLKTKHPKGGDMAEWPEELRVRQFPELLPVIVTGNSTERTQ